MKKKNTSSVKQPKSLTLFGTIFSVIIVLSLVLTILLILLNPKAKKTEPSLYGRWSWDKTSLTDGTKHSQDAKRSFALVFEKDNPKAYVLTDCNNGSGKYTIQNTKMVFGPIALTKKFCQNSRESVFTKQLSQIESYQIKDGKLFLTLKSGVGVMEFYPLGE